MVIITRQQTEKGQVTLPHNLRQELGLVEGDVVDFVRNELGQIILRKSIQQKQFFGLLDKYNSKESVSLEEIDIKHTGVGNIKYKGSPAMSVNYKGVGEIRQY